jgi:hypothetical protein
MFRAALGGVSHKSSFRRRRNVTLSGPRQGRAYGQVLLLKVALVHVAAALGGHHRFFEMSKLLGITEECLINSAGKHLMSFAACFISNRYCLRVCLSLLLSLCPVRYLARDLNKRVRWISDVLCTGCNT